MAGNLRFIDSCARNYVVKDMCAKVPVDGVGGPAEGLRVATVGATGSNENECRAAGVATRYSITMECSGLWRK